MTTDLFSDFRKIVAGASGASSDFDLNPDVELPPNRKLRPAGVLVPMLEKQGELQVILTKRSAALKHHPGQISFPGGKVEDRDTDVVDAALREAHEEIGLRPNNVEVLTTLAPHETVTSFTVTPVLARVRADFEPIPEAGEVAEVFTVPMQHLMQPDMFSVQYRMWQGQQRRYYTVPYGPYYIWGATARILRRLADVVT